MFWDGLLSSLTHSHFYTCPDPISQGSCYSGSWQHWKSRQWSYCSLAWAFLCICQCVEAGRNTLLFGTEKGSWQRAFVHHGWARKNTHPCGRLPAPHLSSHLQPQHMLSVWKSIYSRKGFKGKEKHFVCFKTLNSFFWDNARISGG